MIHSIFHRTSIRQFLDKEVEQEKITTILKSAMAAPSAGNQQPWEFYVVKNKEKMKQLANVSPYAKCVENAAIVFVICYHTVARHPEYCQIDSAIATQNMLLAIDDLGLGAVWLGVAPIAERMDFVDKVIGIEQHLTSFAIVACGYPATEHIEKDRYRENIIYYID